MNRSPLFLLLSIAIALPLIWLEQSLISLGAPVFVLMVTATCGFFLLALTFMEDLKG